MPLHRRRTLFPMKRKTPPKSLARAPLVRSREVFEFLVRDPYGSSAIAGYRRAARHFGLHTREDPAFEGSDAYRMFVHKDPRKLRVVAKAIGDVNEKCEDDTLDDQELEIFLKTDVTYFAQDWHYWDETADEAALKDLGWKRRIAESTDKSGNQIFRVTLKRSRKG
jgi:hypothetical protein